MASLPPLTGYNLGGIDQFWFIAVDQVQSIPDEDENVILQDIQLVGDAKFNVGYATQETLQFTENQNQDAQGNFYEQSLSGFYPKDQEGVANLFEGMAAERFIVIFRDNNGYYKLLGSLDNPCKFQATFETGDKANGRNGYSFEFTRTDVAKAPFYQANLLTNEKEIDTDPCTDRIKAVKKTQTYTFTFEANSSKINAQLIEYNGTIQQIDSPVGYSLYKSTKTSPFQSAVGVGDTVNEHDILTFELDSKPSSQVKVEIVVSYQDISSNIQLPEDLGGNYRYLYDICEADQTVHVIDTDTDSNITTITLPTGFNFLCGCYRVPDKNGYIFDSGGEVAVIDCDPSSANFNTVINQFTINTTNLNDCFYDYDHDLFFITSSNKPFELYDPQGNMVKTNIRSDAGKAKNAYYMHGLGLYYAITKINRQHALIDNNIDYYGLIANPLDSNDTSYYYKGNLLLFFTDWDMRGINIFKDSNGQKFQQLFAVGSNTSGNAGHVIDPINDKAISTRLGTDTYAVFDLTNYTLASTHSFSGNGNQALSRGCFSYYSKQCYIQEGSGGSNVLVFDLNKSSPYQSMIQSGNKPNEKKTAKQTIFANGLKL